MPEPLEAPPEHDDSYLDIPIHQLPPLPERGQRYRVEPFFAVCVVGTYVITFVVLVNLCVFLDGIEPLSGKVPALALIWTWAAIAVVSSAYILVGDPGEIKRGPDTCYPMPQEVRDRLLRKESLTGLGNLPGPEGHPKLGSYCIRCLVWRPPTKRDSAYRTLDQSHHCSICQRCVTGFDHHCGVYGRCIAHRNMIPFYLVHAVWALGALTALVVFIISAINWW
eukprot:TRINITY_DN26827_c0_g1_i2.p1 TRINITY_DN26827_c0_g1~~TRINITY_DN26827_c0_g1_i2.p1  ORF type:complete len:247 (+),score=63.11 TRINITY_DN26827_c0_g1_i2:75-743(+)